MTVRSKVDKATGVGSKVAVPASKSWSSWARERRTPNRGAPYSTESQKSKREAEASPPPPIGSHHPLPTFQTQNLKEKLVPRRKSCNSTGRVSRVDRFPGSHPIYSIICEVTGKRGTNTQAGGVGPAVTLVSRTPKSQHGLPGAPGREVINGILVQVTSQQAACVLRPLKSRFISSQTYHWSGQRAGPSPWPLISRRRASNVGKASWKPQALFLAPLAEIFKKGEGAKINLPEGSRHRSVLPQRLRRHRGLWPPLNSQV